MGGSGWSTSAAWVDLDNDGLLDLVVLRYLQWDFDDIWCGDHKEGLPRLLPSGHVQGDYAAGLSQRGKRALHRSWGEDGSRDSGQRTGHCDCGL